jgi:uncharacterized cupredoxin-like copper-binding protein
MTRLAGILLLTLVLAFLLSVSVPSAQAQVSLTIDLRDVLAFEPNRITVNPGENVTIRVVNSGVLQHTFTLFAEVNAQVPVDNNAALRDFYARSPTLVDVDLAGGEEATVNFTAPMAEGAYTFVCIVSGHSVGGMHGLLSVGMAPGDGDPFGGIGIVQGIFIITLIGVGIFVVIYQIRSTRP